MTAFCARTSRRGPRRAIGPVLRRGAPGEENGCLFCLFAPPVNDPHAAKQATKQAR